MNWLTVATSLLGTWAFLRVLGGERQRLIQELPPEPAPAAEAPPIPPTAAGKTAKPNQKPR